MERTQPATANKKLSRGKRWTENIAVGNQPYVGKISEPLQYKRRRLVIEENDDGWSVLWESLAHYSILKNSLPNLLPPRDIVKCGKAGWKSCLSPIAVAVLESTG